MCSRIGTLNPQNIEMFRKRPGKAEGQPEAREPHRGVSAEVRREELQGVVRNGQRDSDKALVPER